MKPDALSVSPGLLPNAGRLHAEIVKAVSYAEVQKDLRGVAPEQGKTLDTYLSAVKTYMSSGSLVDSSAPTMASGLIDRSDAARVLTLTFSEVLDASVVPASSAFVSSPVKSWASVVVSGNTVVLTATTDWAAGATTIAYTQPGTNGLRDLAGNLVANITATSVTNQA